MAKKTSVFLYKVTKISPEDSIELLRLQANSSNDKFCVHLGYLLLLFEYPIEVCLIFFIKGQSLYHYILREKHLKFSFGLSSDVTTYIN